MTERTNPILKHFRTDNVSSSFRSHDKCTNILSQLVAQLRCCLYFYVSSSCGNMWYQQKKVWEHVAESWTPLLFK